MVELASPSWLRSVIDEAHQRARRRRALSAAAAITALALAVALSLFFGFRSGDGGGALGVQPRVSSAASRATLRAPWSFGGIRKPPGGALLRQKRELIARPTAVGSAVVWTAPDWAVRGTCRWLTVANGIYGGECRRSEPLRHGLSEVVPLELQVKGHTVDVLWGNVGDDVASLQLRFQDGSAAAVPLAKGGFLYVVPKGRRATGHVIARLTAHGRNGSKLSRRLEFSSTPRR